MDLPDKELSDVQIDCITADGPTTILVDCPTMPKNPPNTRTTEEPLVGMLALAANKTFGVLYEMIADTEPTRLYADTANRKDLPVPAIILLVTRVSLLHDVDTQELDPIFVN